MSDHSGARVGDESARGTRCPACAEPAPVGALFCEACGAALPQPAGTLGAQAQAAADPAPAADSRAEVGSAAAAESPAGLDAADHSAPCPGCGAAPDEVDADGYCTRCGLRRPSPRDHQEVEVDAALAGVTDRGVRHHRNEDAQALGRTISGWSVMVVCDGVSTTQRPDEASQAAADAALAELMQAAATEPSNGQLAEHTRQAISKAQSAVLAIPIDPPKPPYDLGAPSCTIVTAVTRPGGATIGWLGDSRAYRLHADGQVSALTSDHSWAVEQVSSGALSEVEAQQDARAHIITRWLGADAAEPDPAMATVQLEPGDRVLLCSDGLWNYAETTAALAELISAVPPGATAVELARTLVAYARDCGGHDNITVTVCDQGEPSSPAPAHSPADKIGN